MLDKEVFVTPKKGLIIKQSSVFNFDDLYKETHNWFLSSEYKFQEKTHSQKMTDLGKEIIIEWEAEREVTDYIKFHLVIKFTLRNVNKVSKTLERGNMQIDIIANLVLDYKEKWQSRPLNNLLFKFYNNHIIKKTIKHYKEKLYNEVLEFQDLVKEQLSLFS